MEPTIEMILKENERAVLQLWAQKVDKLYQKESANDARMETPK